MKVKFEVVQETVERALIKAGLNEEQAKVCAATHAKSSRDGVYSHEPRD